MKPRPRVPPTGGTWEAHGAYVLAVDSQAGMPVMLCTAHVGRGVNGFTAAANAQMFAAAPRMRQLLASICDLFEPTCEQGEVLLDDIEVLLGELPPSDADSPVV